MQELESSGDFYDGQVIRPEIIKSADLGSVNRPVDLHYKPAALKEGFRRFVHSVLDLAGIGHERLLEWTYERQKAFSFRSFLPSIDTARRSAFHVTTPSQLVVKWGSGDIEIAAGSLTYSDIRDLDLVTKMALADGTMTSRRIGDGQLVGLAEGRTVHRQKNGMPFSGKRDTLHIFLRN